MSTGLLRHRSFVEAMQARGVPAADDAIAIATAYTEQAGKVAQVEKPKKGKK